MNLTRMELRCDEKSMAHRDHVETKSKLSAMIMGQFLLIWSNAICGGVRLRAVRKGLHSQSYHQERHRLAALLNSHGVCCQSGTNQRTAKQVPHTRSLRDESGFARSEYAGWHLTDSGRWSHTYIELGLWPNFANPRYMSVDRDEYTRSFRPSAASNPTMPVIEQGAPISSLYHDAGQ